jgi:hypothetical protein
LTKEVTKFDKNSRRLRERLRLALPARVLGRESRDREWTEMTRMVDISPFGARLRLSRPTEPGRLLHLTMAMPRQLRVFDHAEDQYRIWGVVRNVKLLNPAKEKGALVEVGIAFIGKRAPQSFEANPAKRYEIAQTELEAGLWTTADSSEQLSEVAQIDNDKRKESRQLIPVEVLIEVFDEGKLVMSENTVTENIGRKGAAIFTALDIAPGVFVKMSSEQYQAVVLAVVRGKHRGADGITRLHLEFVGSEWPL